MALPSVSRTRSRAGINMATGRSDLKFESRNGGGGCQGQALQSNSGEVQCHLGQVLVDPSSVDRPCWCGSDVPRW